MVDRTGTGTARYSLPRDAVCQALGVCWQTTTAAFHHRLQWGSTATPPSPGPRQVHRVETTMVSYQSVGIVSLALYGALAVAAAWRLVSHCSGCLSQKNSSSIRRTFHVLIVVFASLQICAFVPFAFDGSDYTAVSYACHLLGMCVLATAFSLVTILWGRTMLHKKQQEDENLQMRLAVQHEQERQLQRQQLQQQQQQQQQLGRRTDGSETSLASASSTSTAVSMPVIVSQPQCCWDRTCRSCERAAIPAVLTLDLVFFVYIVVTIADMLLHDHKTWKSWAEGSATYRYSGIVESAALLLNAVLVLSWGRAITVTLQAHPNWQTLQEEDKARVVFRLIGTMVTCSLCFCLRVASNLYIFISLAGDGNVNTDHDILWWIFAQWAPTMVPSVLLLHMLRRVNHPDPSFSSTTTRWHMHTGPSPSAAAGGDGSGAGCGGGGGYSTTSATEALLLATAAGDHSYSVVYDGTLSSLRSALPPTGTYAAGAGAGGAMTNTTQGCGTNGKGARQGTPGNSGEAQSHLQPNTEPLLGHVNAHDPEVGAGIENAAAVAASATAAAGGHLSTMSEPILISAYARQAQEQRQQESPRHHLTTGQRISEPEVPEHFFASANSTMADQSILAASLSVDEPLLSTIVVDNLDDDDDIVLGACGSGGGGDSSQAQSSGSAYSYVSTTDQDGFA